MIERKCKNCGATFEGNKCPWCRTVYEDIPFEGRGAILTVGDEKIRGYIGKVEAQTEIDSYVDQFGCLTRRVSNPKRTFTFVEI